MGDQKGFTMFWPLHVWVFLVFQNWKMWHLCPSRFEAKDILSNGFHLRPSSEIIFCSWLEALAWSQISILPATEATDGQAARLKSFSFTGASPAGAGVLLNRCYRVLFLVVPQVWAAAFGIGGHTLQRPAEELVEVVRLEPMAADVLP